MATDTKARTARKLRRRMDVYAIEDSWPTLGVARCPEGDRLAFDRLASELLNMLGEDRGAAIKDPVWRWYRMNPCPPDGDYAWMLGHPNGPGRGNWMGAEVVLADGAP